MNLAVSVPHAAGADALVERDVVLVDGQALVEQAVHPEPGIQGIRPPCGPGLLQPPYHYRLALMLAVLEEHAHGGCAERRHSVALPLTGRIRQRERHLLRHAAEVQPAEVHKAVLLVHPDHPAHPGEDVAVDGVAVFPVHAGENLPRTSGVGHRTLIVDSRHVLTSCYIP